MATIAYLSTGGQVGMKLVKEQYIRPMAWGNEWAQLRIAIRMGYEAPNSSNQSGSFFVGVCSNSLQWNDANCVIVGFFFGAITGGFPGYSPLNWVGGAAPYYSSSSNGYRGVVKVGSSYTLVGSASEGSFYPILPLTQIVGAYIDRSFLTNQIAPWGGYNNNSFNAYVGSRYVSLINLDDQTMPYAFMPRGGGTAALTTSAPLNCVFVANFGTVPLALFDIGVQRTL